MLNLTGSMRINRKRSKGVATNGRKAPIEALEDVPSSMWPRLSDVRTSFIVVEADQTESNECIMDEKEARVRPATCINIPLSREK